MVYDQLVLIPSYTMFPMKFATDWGCLPPYFPWTFLNPRRNGPSDGDHVKNNATTGMETCNAK